MKLTVQLKLLPTPQQSEALRSTLGRLSPIRLCWKGFLSTMLTLAIPLAPVRTVGIVRKRTVERSLHLCAHPAASKASQLRFRGDIPGGWDCGGPYCLSGRRKPAVLLGYRCCFGSTAGAPE